MSYKIDNDGFLIYKGVKLSLTVEHLVDTKLITGLSSDKIIEFSYQKEIVHIRDSKIDQIINPLN